MFVTSSKLHHQTLFGLHLYMYMHAAPLLQTNGNLDALIRQYLINAPYFLLILKDGGSQHDTNHQGLIDFSIWLKFYQTANHVGTHNQLRPLLLIPWNQK